MHDKLTVEQRDMEIKRRVSRWIIPLDYIHDDYARNAVKEAVTTIVEDTLHSTCGNIEQVVGKLKPKLSNDIMALCEPRTEEQAISYCLQHSFSCEEEYLKHKDSFSDDYSDKDILQYIAIVDSRKRVWDIVHFLISGINSLELESDS